MDKSGRRRTAKVEPVVDDEDGDAFFDIRWQEIEVTKEDEFLCPFPTCDRKFPTFASCTTHQVEEHLDKKSKSALTDDLVTKQKYTAMWANRLKKAHSSDEESDDPAVEGSSAWKPVHKYQYIHMGDDTGFIESCGFNQNFDGQNMYLPVCKDVDKSRARKEELLYKLHAKESTRSKKLKHFNEWPLVDLDEWQWSTFNMLDSSTNMAFLGVLTVFSVFFLQMLELNEYAHWCIDVSITALLSIELLLRMYCYSWVMGPIFPCSHIHGSKAPVFMLSMESFYEPWVVLLDVIYQISACPYLSNQVRTPKELSQTKILRFARFCRFFRLLKLLRISSSVGKTFKLSVMRVNLAWHDDPDNDNAHYGFYRDELQATVGENMDRSNSIWEKKKPVGPSGLATAKVFAHRAHDRAHDALEHVHDDHMGPGASPHAGVRSIFAKSTTELKKEKEDKMLKDSQKLTRVLGDVVLSEDDGKSDLTCFGSVMGEDGMLWLCIFNQNLIMGLDMNPDPNNKTQDGLPGPKCMQHIEGAYKLVPKPEHVFPCCAPNDVCIDKLHNRLYVAGGTYFFAIPCIGFKGIPVPSAGSVYAIDIDSGKNIESGGQPAIEHTHWGYGALAGILYEEKGGLWLSKLWEIECLGFPDEGDDAKKRWPESGRLKFFKPGEGVGTRSSQKARMASQEFATLQTRVADTLDKDGKIANVAHGIVESVNSATESIDKSIDKFAKQGPVSSKVVATTGVAAAGAATAGAGAATAGVKVVKQASNRASDVGKTLGLIGEKEFQGDGTEGSQGTVWRAVNSMTENGMHVLADNLRDFGDGYLVSPAYRELDASSLNFMNNVNLANVGYLAAKLMTFFINLMPPTCQITSLSNPEVHLSFSTQDKFENIHFLLVNVTSSITHNENDRDKNVKGTPARWRIPKKWWKIKEWQQNSKTIAPLSKSKFKHLHLKIPMADIQPPKDGKGVDEFDGHITHIEKLQGKCSYHTGRKNRNCADCMGQVCFVNFKSNWVLLVDGRDFNTAVERSQHRAAVQDTTASALGLLSKSSHDHRAEAAKIVRTARDLKSEFEFNDAAAPMFSQQYKDEWQKYKNITTFKEWDASFTHRKLADRKLADQVMKGRVTFEERVMAAVNEGKKVGSEKPNRWKDVSREINKNLKHGINVGTTPAPISAAAETTTTAAAVVVQRSARPSPTNAGGLGLQCQPCAEPKPSKATSTVQLNGSKGGSPLGDKSTYRRQSSKKSDYGGGAKSVARSALPGPMESLVAEGKKSPGEIRLAPVAAKSGASGAKFSPVTRRHASDP